jgi:hypothetical protein
MDLSGIINATYNGFTGDQDQHNFMVNNMMPVFKDILNQLKSQLYTTAQINKAEYPDTAGGYQLYAPNTSTTPISMSSTKVSWNWNDYFTHFSYYGLENCSAYLQVYPVNSVPLYYKTKYLTGALLMFTP